MRATLQAAKEAGIKFIVFLSSFTIKGGLRQVNPGARIPYMHAQVELNLEEIYGHQNYVALRAGAFATNTLGWRTGIATGEVVLDATLQGEEGAVEVEEERGHSGAPVEDRGWRRGRWCWNRAPAAFRVRPGYPTDRAVAGA